MPRYVLVSLRDIPIEARWKASHTVKHAEPQELLMAVVSPSEARYPIRRESYERECGRLALPSRGEE